MDGDEKRNANDKKIPGSGSVNDKKLPISGNVNDKKSPSSEKSSPRNSPIKTPLAGKKLVNLKDFYDLTKDENTSEADSSKAAEPSKTDDNITNGDSKNAQTKTVDEKISACQDVVKTPSSDDPFDFVGYSQANSALTVYCNRLPPPTVFGDGNPFLMFLCLSCLLQHRDHIMTHELDYQDIAMYFDRLVRGHHVDKVL